MAGIHDVRWYHGDFAGVTRSRVSETNAASQIIQVLDDCLVNGFNLQVIESIQVVDGVATCTTTNNHNYLNGVVLRIAGATPAELNGDWKITSSIGKSFTFDTAVPNGSATGSMTAKVAPLGWSKPFSGTNLAVYRPASGLRYFYRVSDPAGNFAYIRGFENMTGVDAGVSPFPLSTQVVGTDGIAWLKYPAASGYSSRWKLIGDDRFFYFIFDPSESAGYAHSGTFGTIVYAVGEVPSFIPGDIGSSVVTGGPTNASFSSTRADDEGLRYIGFESPNAFSGNYFARPYNQGSGTPTRFRALGHSACSGWGVLSNPTYAIRYPNPADSSLLLHYPVLLNEENNTIRGTLPGVYQVIQTGASSLDMSVTQVNGKTIWLLNAPSHIDNDENSGLMGFDITGPWR